MNAIVVSSRQFRDRQREFLDIADRKQNKVFIRRGRRMFLITPMDEESAKMQSNVEVNPEVLKEIDQAEEDYKNGKYIRINPNDLWNSLNTPASL